MRGISPVIATVMLLLLAVAAVGSSWVFINNIQRTTTASGAGQFEQIKAQASSSISVDSIITTEYITPINDTIVVKLANPSGGVAKITRVLLENTTNFQLSNTSTLAIAANSFTDVSFTLTDFELSIYCATTTYIKVTVYSDAFVPVRDYPVECRY
ncbi:MAG: hypothetical protein GOU98_04065 [Candidatus Altiarchaeota archaeon]|nr:hypothetical protein [Candidatus Altiarchaeota archaeon]